MKPRTLTRWLRLKLSGVGADGARTPHCHLTDERTGREIYSGSYDCCLQYAQLHGCKVAAWNKREVLSEIAEARAAQEAAWSERYDLEASTTRS